MAPRALVALLAHFTGLGGALPDALPDEATRRCTPSRSRHEATRSPRAPEQLAPAEAPLRRLVEPYNRLLAELVHPAFRWSAGELQGRAGSGKLRYNGK